MRRVVVAGGLGAFALSNLEGWLNDNREWISEQAEASLGRPVSFEQVGVSLGLGLGVEVTGLRIADDPSYAEEDLVSIDEARIGVRVLPALQGRYEISHVTLVRPDVRIVKTDAGLNIEALGGGASEEEPADASGSAALVALTNIESGRITFTDRTVDPPHVVRRGAAEYNGAQTHGGPG